MADPKFVGIQISPISFIDEGVDDVLDTLQHRVGVNVLMIGTVSWLGLKAGRSISYKLDGWPDHGVAEPIEMKGGAYFNPHPEYLPAHQHQGLSRAQDEVTAGFDVLEAVIPEAKARGMRVMPELMEPLFKYAGHGSANNVAIANMPQYLEVDRLRPLRAGAVHQQPGLPALVVQPDRGPLPQLRHRRHHVVQRTAQPARPDDRGQAPGCFCEHCRREAMSAWHRRRAGAQGVLAVWEYFQQARAGSQFVDGA